MPYDAVFVNTLNRPLILTDLLLLTPAIRELSSMSEISLRSHAIPKQSVYDEDLPTIYYYQTHILITVGE